MKRDSITSFAEYSDLVSEYKSDKSFTNNYMMKDEVEGHIAASYLSFFTTAHNLYLFVLKPKCQRLYYYLNDLNELCTLDENTVVEILFRGNACFPEREVEYFKCCGFMENLIRDLYSGMYKDLHTEHGICGDDVRIRPAEDINQVRLACELFNETFDPYSGDFIPEEDFSSLLTDGSILIATDNSDRFMGALHQSRRGTVAWAHHLAVSEEYRGRHLGKALFSTFVENNHMDGYDRYQFWVQHQNIVSVNMYNKMGFRHINKSTISLLYLK